MERWKGKVAMVTGASSGIGAAIAEKLALAGVVVVGLARNHERIIENAKQIKGELHAFKADMTKEDEIKAAFEWTIAKFGPIRILVNNAGIVQDTDLINGDTNKWRAIFETNVIGLSIATREAIQSMLGANVDGHVVHINSIAGHKVFANNNVYSASKFAVTNLTEALRQELVGVGSRIKITSVSPGAVRTNILTNAQPERAEMLSKIPKLEANDVADVVIFALGTPEHVQIHEVIVKVVGEEF